MRLGLFGSLLVEHWCVGALSNLCCRCPASSRRYKDDSENLAVRAYIFSVEHCVSL